MQTRGSREASSRSGFPSHTLTDKKWQTCMLLALPETCLLPRHLLLSSMQSSKAALGTPVPFIHLLAFQVTSLGILLFKEPLFLLSCPGQCSNYSTNQLNKRGINCKERLMRIQDRNLNSSRLHGDLNVVSLQKEAALSLRGFMTALPSTEDLQSCLSLITFLMPSAADQSMMATQFPLQCGHS